MRALRVITVLVVVGATPLGGQALSSQSYLPLDHWATPFLEHLVVRGAIADPSPMVRPWVVGEIVAALDQADATALSFGEEQTLRRIENALRPPTGDAVFTFALALGGRAGTHARRDPVRAAGEGKVLPAVDGHVALEVGRFVLMAQRTLDWNLRYDPDYTGDKQAPLQGRAEYAYGAFRSGYVALEFGTLYRNWGPPAHVGLLVSPVPYSYDRFALRLGVDRLNMEVFVAQLDEMPSQSGERITRWWIVHRYHVRPARVLDLSLYQSTLVAGPARGLDLAFLNPFRFAVDTRNDVRAAANSQVALDMELRLGQLPRIGLSFLIDDQVNCFISAFCPLDFGDEPPSFGFTLALDGRLFGGAWSAVYTQVSNLAYRTNDPAETMMIRGVGVARNFSDYDQATVQARWIPLPGVIVGPELTLLRQGEGDFRLPFPTAAEFDTTATLFQGIVERTWRGALHASVALPLGISARGNIGVHRVLNAGHVAGATDTEFVATLEARYGFGLAKLIR